MIMHLRGSGSSNIASRLPAPGMFIKSAAPIRFAIPQRPVMKGGSLLGSQSSHVFFNSGYPSQAAPLKRPYAAHLTASPGLFKLSTQSSQKTAIKFHSPPTVPLKSKPEYIYEKVNVPKHPDPVRYSISSDGAIHTIPAPNLSLNEGSPVPEITGNNLNSLFDSDLATFSAHGFALEKPVNYLFKALIVNLFMINFSFSHISTKFKRTTTTTLHLKTLLLANKIITHLTTIHH